MSEQYLRSINWLLLEAVALLSVLLGSIIVRRRKGRLKDRQLLQRKEEQLQLQEALAIEKEEEHQSSARQLISELEQKEGQLSALTMQLLQKNELLQELKAQLDKGKPAVRDASIGKIIDKGLRQDDEWSDFNANFESINRNFYARLKQVHTDISPNDLKLCMLLKMNLSSKEMAGILNVSPDSVKTARYRLRKKLRLSAEDNLTDFILGL